MPDQGPSRATEERISLPPASKERLLSSPDSFSCLWPSLSPHGFTSLGNFPYSSLSSFPDYCCPHMLWPLSVCTYLAFYVPSLDSVGQILPHSGVAWWKTPLGIFVGSQHCLDIRVMHIHAELWAVPLPGRACGLTAFCWMCTVMGSWHREMRMWQSPVQPGTNPLTWPSCLNHHLECY